MHHSKKNIKQHKCKLKKIYIYINIYVIPNQYIIMNSVGSCDTEDWSNGGWKFNISSQEIITCKLTLKYSYFRVYSVALANHKWNDENYLSHLHIINSLVHIIKAVSHSFEQVTIVLVHSCNCLCIFVCSFLHYGLLMSCCLKCIICDPLCENSAKVDFLWFTVFYIKSSFIR